MAGAAADHSNDFGIVNPLVVIISIILVMYVVGPHNAFNKVSDCIYVSDSRSRGHKFDPLKVLYFQGDRSERSSTFILLLPPIPQGLLSVTSKSMCP